MRKSKPEGVFLTWYDFNLMEAGCSDPLMVELIRLARIGYTTEAHANAIDRALKTCMGGRSVAELTPYERALDGLKNAKVKI